MGFIDLKRTLTLFLHIAICMPMFSFSATAANGIFGDGVDQTFNGSDSDSKVTLTWIKPDDDRIIGYNIYCGKLGSDFKSMPYASVYSSDNTGYCFSELETGYEYLFAATSFDAQGNESDFSEVIHYVVKSLMDEDGDGYTENEGDCNNSDISIFPGAIEICGDGVDQDCDGDDLDCLEYIDDGGTLNSNDIETDINDDCINEEIDMCFSEVNTNIEDNNSVDDVCDSNSWYLIALFNPDTSSFYFKKSFSGGAADIKFRFGSKNSDCLSIAGDWNGSGQVTVGLFDSGQSRFYLKNTLSGGIADVVFDFFPVGCPDGKNWIPISGDWDGNGQCGIGLYDPLNSTFYLKNSLPGRNADYAFRFGPLNEKLQPIAGDWDGDGRDSIGLYAPQTGILYLKNSLSGGIADISFRYGPQMSTWIALSGDWDGDGIDSVGLFDPTASSFYLKNSFSGGNADIQFSFGPDGMGWLPLAGSW